MAYNCFCGCSFFSCFLFFWGGGGIAKTITLLFSFVPHNRSFFITNVASWILPFAEHPSLVACTKASMHPSCGCSRQATHHTNMHTRSAGATPSRYRRVHLRPISPAI